MARSTKKRRGARTTFKVPILLQLDKDGPGYNAKILNFSSNGIYFETDCKLIPGAQIYLSMNESVNDSAASIKGHYKALIVWIKELKNSAFSYGYGAFDISDSDTSSRRRRFLRVKPDSRKHIREITFKPVSFYLHRRIIEGYIYNLSRGGAFVRIKHRFNVGRIVQFAIAGDKVSRGVIIKCQVVHSSAAGIGVKFKSLKKISHIIKDRGGIRSGADRRRIYALGYASDKRSGKDRRSGYDRRTYRFIQHRKGIPLRPTFRELS